MRGTALRLRPALFCVLFWAAAPGLAAESAALIAEHFKDAPEGALIHKAEIARDGEMRRLAAWIDCNARQSVGRALMTPPACWAGAQQAAQLSGRTIPMPEIQ